MRPLPQRVAGLGGEQTPASQALTEDREPCADLLVEPGVVADLVDQIRIGDHESGAGRHADLVDGAILAGHLDQALDRAVAVDVEDVAEEGHSARAGDVVDVDRRSHGSLPMRLVGTSHRRSCRASGTTRFPGAGVLERQLGLRRWAGRVKGGRLPCWFTRHLELTRSPLIAKIAL